MQKRYVVCYPKEARKVGIAANNFGELVQSACNRFKVPLKGTRILLEDGTEVEDDDYFSCLPEDTLFVLTPKKEASYALWTMTSNLLSKIWKLPLPPTEEMHSLITKFISNKETRQHIQDMLEKSAINLDDSRKGDAAWFRGIPDKVTSKKEHMSKNAKDRVRGYYTRTKDEVERLLFGSQSRKSDQESSSHRVFRDMFEEMRKELQTNGFHSGYFNRGDRALRLCNEDGWFKCQGEYNSNSCTMQHRLNPYGSREARIIFSTWNLDHVIERSRSIIPALDEAIRNAERQINWKYFYNLLFLARGTEAHLQDGNLKLVHIVCHVKAAHTNFTCDTNKYYVLRHKIGRHKK